MEHAQLVTYFTKTNYRSDEKRFGIYPHDRLLQTYFNDFPTYGLPMEEQITSYSQPAFCVISAGIYFRLMLYWAYLNQLIEL